MASKKRSISGAPKIEPADLITYVSLLRGVNVGGGNVIKKDKLQSAFENVGCINVRTYIQSGNIVFEAPVHVTRGDLLLSVKNSLRRYLAKDIDILVFSKAEWQIVVSSSPFSRKTIDDSAASSSRSLKGKVGAVTVKTEYVTFLCTGDHNLCHCVDAQDPQLCSAKGSAAAAQLAAQVSKLKIADEDDYCIVNNDLVYVPVVYTYTPRGITEGKYTAKMFHDKHSGVNTTTRNFDTILKLLDMTSSPPM